ncbi:BNR repeat-containing protein [Coraliomargarita sp. W4R72]
MKIKPLITLTVLTICSARIVYATKNFEEFESPPVPRVTGTQEIDYVWAGHSVGFSLYTHTPYQYALYYDANRQATIAQRKLDSNKWHYAKINTYVTWDSHNYLTLAVDRQGYLHISGNMHGVPLIYFRSKHPHDITRFQPLPMTGKNEERTTYPRFMNNKAGDLIFHYRDGSSGNGVNYYNIYNDKTQTWSRLLDTPLVDGLGKMNAYVLGPEIGPDGNFHISWVWRDTIYAETNHDLSYARSADLINWETIDGNLLDLPMTIDTPGLIVDPIPSGGGIINGSGRVGFDSQERPVITYHKFDEDGNTQIYHARREGSSWKFYQSTHWDYRWEFKGGGSLSKHLRHGSITPHRKGELMLSITHKKYKNGRYILNEDDFSLIRIEPASHAENELARRYYQVESNFPGMQRLKAIDSGESPDLKINYELKWETLGSFRDVSRPKPWPAPSRLWLYEIQTEN